MSDNLNLFIVDDEDIIVELFAAYMDEYNISIDSALTISKFKTAFDQNKYKALIIDWNLPDGSGLDVAKYIRSISQTYPILFWSSKFTPEMLESANQYNPIKCIEKSGQNEYYEETANLIKSAAKEHNNI